MWRPVALQHFMTIAETKAADEVAFKEMEQRKADKKFDVPSSLTEKPKSRTLAIVPADFPVTKCDPGKAQGLEPARMRAKGERGSNSREPREDTKRALKRKLEAMKGSLSPAMYLAACKRLGV